MKQSEMRVLFDEATILRRIDQLAREIDDCYGTDSPVVICVLKGAFMFFSDLTRRLHCGPALDFVALSSYGNGTCPGECVTMLKDVSLPLEGRHVLVVEDIVDSGRSMTWLLERLRERGPRSVRLAALIDKTQRREAPVHVDFAGFCIADGFIVGYGLDHAERHRELPALYEVIDA